MKQELKRCPFCGGYAVYKYEERQDGTDLRKYVYIMCSNCAVSTMTSPVKDLCSEYPDKYSPKFPDIYEPYDGEKEVAQTWNRRIDDTASIETEALSEEDILALNISYINRKLQEKNGKESEALYKVAHSLTKDYNEIQTFGDIICLSPEELAEAVETTGEKGYNEVVDILSMYGIDTEKYRRHQYKELLPTLWIGVLDLDVRPFDALLNSNIRTIADITRLSQKELKQIKGLGKKGYNQLINALSAVGIDTSKYTR